MAHTGMIGMGLKKEFRNQGIGTFLLTEIIHWAKTKSPLEVIWLDVYSSNPSGQNLYKKLNFQVSGIIPNFFKQNNTYHNKIQMYLDLI